MTDQSKAGNEVCPKPQVQNEETIAAIIELEAGKGTRFATVDALMADLKDDN